MKFKELVELIHVLPVLLDIIIPMHLTLVHYVQQDIYVMENQQEPHQQILLEELIQLLLLIKMCIMEKFVLKDITDQKVVLLLLLAQ